MSNEISTVEDFQADVVVVGAGGAGLPAAITAREKRANVILLEKRPNPGGNGAIFGGIFGAESVAQKRLGIDARRDELFKRAMNYSHWRADPKLVRILIDKSGDTISWLEDRGLYFDRIYPLYPGQLPPTDHFSGEGFTGPKFVEAMIKNCQEIGVKMMCSCGAKKLLTDEEGSVNGVLAASEGKEIKIKAKSVIIATGGFAGNKELMQKYYPSYNENVITHGLPLEGDGLLMGMGIGAATEGLGAFEMGGPSFQWSRPLNLVARDASTVWVNRIGERFADEAVTFQFPESGNILNRQPDKICYALLGEEIKESIIEEGLVSGGIGFFKLLKIKMTMGELEKEFRAQADEGKVKISDSWDEIAEWIGADPATLKTTVDEYNRFCDQGHDEVFVKDQRYLIPLRTPPYYAIKCCQGLYTTLGGLKINHRMEVLNQQDTPIRGLYAAGVDAGGWEADTYNYAITGHSISFSISTGRIAGGTAAEYALG